MATVNLIDPYSQQAEEIARRQRMAQALQESGSQVLQMPTTPGVAISPYAGLAKILEAGLGSYQEKKARQDYANLQNKYRTNYNTQFGNLARAISAPAQEAFAGQEAVPGQEAIPAKPAVMAPQIEKSFGGYGMPREVGQYEVSPAVAGKEAVPGQAEIPARPAVPAGYISPETLQGIDIPEVKQLAMAKYLAQFEPNQVKLGPGESLYTQTGKGGPLTPLVTGTTKADKLAPHWEATTQEIGGKLVAGWINLNATDKAASFVAGAKPTEAKTATPHWVVGQKDVNGTTQFGWYDLNAADKDASFKAGANPPAGEKSNWKEVTRNNQVFYEDFNVADVAKRQAGAIAKEAAKVDQIQLEVEDETGAKKTILVKKDDPRLATGIATKGADTVMITDVNDKGQTTVRYVKKGDPILTTGYVKPLDGFLGQLQQAGVPIDKIQSDPKIRDLVDRYFVKTAGGVAPEEAASFELRKAEVVARLGELGIAIPANIKGLGLSATPGVLGGTQSSNAAPAAPPAPASAALQMPANKNQLVNGQTYQTPKGEMKWNAAANRFEK